MSLNEERMLILKMLEEGKITSDEAARLLEALETGSGQSSAEGSFKKQKQSSFHDEASKVRDRINEWKKEFKKNYNKNDFDRMVDDFSSKAEKLGRGVANTTFGIVDKVIDFVGSFVDTTAFNIFGNYKLEERYFDAEAADGMDLLIEGLNGHIIVKKHMDSKVIIKTKVRSPQNNADEILVFTNDANKISLALNKIANISVSHEIFVPAVRFNHVRFETTNAKIYVEDTAAAVFESITKNSTIDLMGVSGDSILVNTKNAKVQLSYVIGKSIDIKTNNSLIDIKNVKSQDVKAVTMNSKIFAENIQNIENCPELQILLKTSNGGIKVNMNDMDNRGYKVKGQTTNGGINLLIPELTYHNINKQGLGGSFIEAESTGYSSYPEKVSIVAETTNGYIEIVK